jgi:hypothetical protein
MVDSIGNAGTNPLLLGDLAKANTEKTSKAEATALGQKAAEAKLASLDDYTDQVELSNEAKTRAAKDLETQRYVRLANRLPEGFDTSKVDYFKGLLEKGGIQGYLSQLDTQSIASSILTGPSAGVFTS